MELKRILARDSRSANEKAIQLYGPEVLIISSQRVDQQTELIVAVDVRAESPGVSVVPTGVEPMLHAPGLAQAADQPLRANAPDFVPFSKIFQSTHDFAQLEPEPAKAAAGAAPALALAPVPSQAALQPSVQSPLQAPVAYAVSAHETQRSQEIVDMLRQEMAALRKEFSLSRQMMPWQDGLALSPDMQKLAMAMSEVGLPAGLRAVLTDSIQSLQRTEEAWPVLQALLTDALARAAAPWPQAGVHALCGPSGSGKSSMVGRLALAAAQSQGAESQVMISFADQRPGAWGQMQLLAAQAGVSCFRAADAAMLQALLDDQWGKTVWIDTCGADFGSQAMHLMQILPKVLFVPY